MVAGTRAHTHARAREDPVRFLKRAATEISLEGAIRTLHYLACLQRLYIATRHCQHVATQNNDAARKHKNARPAILRQNLQRAHEEHSVPMAEVFRRLEKF